MALGRLSTAEQFRSGYLLVGNAAHTLHPVAGKVSITMREVACSRVLWLMQSPMVPIGELDSLRPTCSMPLKSSFW